METLIIHPKNNEQLAALIAVAKAMKVSYETESKAHCILNHTPNSLTAKTIKDAHNGKGIGEPITDIKAFMKSL